MFIRKIHNLLDICVFTELDYFVLIKNDYLAFGRCFMASGMIDSFQNFLSVYNLLNIILPILNACLASMKARASPHALHLDMFTFQQTLFNKMQY